ncbi:MBL fold metallo-hydrolase [Chitinasiproducens palmae]|uniref:L-ascorbate metabolism protein UlaG, beta-lactamase superfamily n=1 Tax=Chitinasiproducens palmae TaxID=1770053 RepID=A0A1H2PJF5_9BURK|nr:MBL fold metallo-hydrolase [Chitinasiproducens palmae]SDV46032.1 L-ascorbate metabolism protein UlaG, beta-lactamase superfamily [Chitinasiproducens palmae]
MKYTHIRNATALVEYAGKRFLVDPMLAERGSYDGFGGYANSELRNPLVDLPLPARDVLDVDAVIVTHTHIDHWDPTAQKLIDKDRLLLAQNARDAALFAAQGFTRVQVLGEETDFDGIRLFKTSGQHGSDALYADPQWAARLGETCGIVFAHADEPTVYLAGDTVWHRHVETALARHAPNVVVLNAGDAHNLVHGSIIMGQHDIERVHRAAPGAELIAVHLEALGHCVLSRAALRGFVRDRSLEHVVRIPEDGDSYVFA